MALPRRQQFVVHLPPELARRAMDEVNSPGSPYDSFSELVAVAVENQLALETLTDELPDQGRTASQIGPNTAVVADARPETISDVTTPQPTAAKSISAIDLLGRPEAQQIPTQAPAEVGDEPLTQFTNRLNPLVAGTRVLVNMVANAGPPEIDAFVQAAAVAARDLGLRLRAEDVRAGRRGRHRRWTAWPVGDDEVKSLTRFRKSFLMSRNGKSADGPMVQLGLATGVDGVAYPTEASVELATAVTPAIDGDGIELLGEHHRSVLARQLLALPGERAEIAAFLEAVDQSDGSQDDVDKRVAHAHKQWSEAQVVSHRAAMLGRLRDLDVLEIDPDAGDETRLIAGPGAEDFRSLLVQAVDQVR